MAEFKHGNRKKSMKRGISASAGKKRNNAARKTLLEKDESAEEDDELKIEDVLELGGDQDDFEMLKNMKAGRKEPEENFDDKEIQNEIKDILKDIGFSGHNKISANNKRSDASDAGDAVDAESNELKDSAKNSEKKKKERVKGTSTDKRETMRINSPDVDTKHDMAISVPVFQKHNKPIIKSDCLWFEQCPDVQKDLREANPRIITEMQELARKLWENEVTIFQEGKRNDKSSDAQWLRTVLSSGTLSDKVAALTMLIQESPVHQADTLEKLVCMTKKKGRREALMAVDSLRHLWITDLLPSRKLKNFKQWPLGSLKDITKSGGKIGQDRILILWYFEEIVKEKYSDFVNSLERLSMDTIADIRNKALGTIFELLAEKPEQEKKLLSMLVNKLGDPDRKVASSASYLLTQLVIKHPDMKLVVTEEVERLLYRPHVAGKAQYYAICFLNQMILTKKDSNLASKLISIFFSFFKAFVSKGVSEAETKQLSALLSGVNRAFPYAKEQDEKYEEQLNMLFRVSHVSNFTTSVQALMLIYQVMDSRQSVSDRYYQALYEKLLDPDVRSSKQTMFLNLVFKSMKADPSLPRVKAFMKRLLQMCAYEESSLVCGVLFLISEVLKIHPGLKSLSTQPEEEDEEEHFVDLTDENDVDDVKEDEKGVNDTKEESSNLDIDEDEKPNSVHQAKTGWTFVNRNTRSNHYDPKTRNPLYSGAQYSCTWETGSLLKHYHPSVGHFTQSVLQGDPIIYKGDPLQDFTLMRFLDRFIYKNPKKNPKEHGSSIMQPKRSSERLREQPVNTANFVKRKEENVRKDEMFFYKYFKMKAEKESQKKSNKPKKKDFKDAADETQGGVSDDEFEDFDFASELRKSKTTQSAKGVKRKRKDDDEQDTSSDEGDFEYEDMDFSEEDEEENLASGPQRKKKWTDKDYEDALLDNLSSDAESMSEEDGDTTKGSSLDVDSMFATADEFAHLLEGSGSSKTNPKQRKWEKGKQQNRNVTRTQKHHEYNSKRNFSGKAKPRSNKKKTRK